MQRTNYIFIFLIFGLFKLNAQPSAQRKISELNISFGTCRNNKIFFEQNDSISFVSKNKKYKLHFELINQNSNNKEIISVISNKYNLSNNLYKFDYIKGAFSLNHNFVTYYNRTPILKSIFKIKLTKEKKEMIVLIDFTNYRKNIELRELFIKFKKGKFKITNPDSLKFVKVTEQ
ncbi:hypothetical protein G1K97_10385 [Tenacibaculum finnmarkense]|uniref:hypothetical protein n=1 Tax=Tenacibaculum finnmarkense TaxID=2781243 RepID=UPI001EFB1DD9|nr:hypothetical protein [Tenacibaculum finnmarkense]MCG8893141.1 hypothetical protein [Tenacibaculum finnmarkense]MCG8902247.1 hypothetical protein [Tenacibaculum finnmarkense]